MIEIDKNVVLKHYSRKEVQDEIVRCSRDKEVVGSYGGKGYARRPDAIHYPSDVMELVKQGITSFHMSEELWENPLSISPLMKKTEIEDLRIGWDLILDIDCNFLEYSKMAAHLLVEALKYQGIKSVSVKFSGNHGFHIGVPYEAFPSQVMGTKTNKLFPEAPRRIALFLKEMIRDHLRKMMLDLDSFDEIVKKSEVPKEELMINGVFDPFVILEIDTILISSRHLLRHVYSFNEKSGWISTPIRDEQIMGFDIKDALPENVNDFSVKFLDRESAVEGEATRLFVQAFDFKPLIQDEYKALAEEKKEYDIPEEAIPELLFPPCIHKILGGLKDGRKRALFILVNFMSSAGWSHEQIEHRLEEWNRKNPEPLKEVMIKGQVRYHKQQKNQILPPNCLNSYYKDLQICFPDNLCNKVRNPIQYSRRKTMFSDNNKKEKKRKSKP